MAQLFNTSSGNQLPPNIPPVHSTSNSSFPSQGQMFHRKPRFRMRTKVFGVLGIMIIAGALPVIIILSGRQQQYQQSAHVPSPSVTAVCQSTEVILTSTFNITNVPNNVTCQITATDSQTYLDDSFSF